LASTKDWHNSFYAHARLLPIDVFQRTEFFLFFSMGAKIHVQQFLDYSKCRGSLLPSIDFFLPVTALLRDPAKGGDLGVGQRTEFF